MTLMTFLSLLAAGAGALSASFFALGTLQLSAQTIFDIAGTDWDVNKHLAASISAQRAEYIAGAALLFLTFLLQIAASLTPPDVQPILLRSQPVAIGLAGGLFVAAAVIARIVCKWLTSRMKANVDELIAIDLAQSEKK